MGLYDKEDSGEREMREIEKGECKERERVREGREGERDSLQRERKEREGRNNYFLVIVLLRFAILRLRLMEVNSLLAHQRETSKWANSAQSPFVASSYILKNYLYVLFLSLVIFNFLFEINEFF